MGKSAVNTPYEPKTTNLLLSLQVQVLPEEQKRKFRTQIKAVSYRLIAYSV